MLVRLAAASARGDDRRDVLLGRGEPAPRLAVPDAVDGQIGREDERREPGLERLCDDLVAHLAVAEDVDLEPARRVRERPRRRRSASRSRPSRGTSASPRRRLRAPCRARAPRARSPGTPSARRGRASRPACRAPSSPSRPTTRRRARAGEDGIARTPLGSSAASARRPRRRRCSSRRRAGRPLGEPLGVVEREQLSIGSRSLSARDREFTPS